MYKNEHKENAKDVIYHEKIKIAEHSFHFWSYLANIQHPNHHGVKLLDVLCLQECLAGGDW